MKKIKIKYFIFSLLAAAVLIAGTAAVSSSAATSADRIELPVVYITTEPGTALTSKKEYSNVEIRIESDDYGKKQLYSGNAQMKLHGNSTLGRAKKSYKLKLETKTDLLGMGKSKHWVLLANAIDFTCLRNNMHQSLAADLGMDHMESRLVTLVYNGYYMGVYELIEHVRIGKTRVNIYDWSDLAEDVADAVVRKYIAEGALRESDYDSKISGVEDTLKADYAWVTDTRHQAVFDNLGGETVRLGDCYDFTDVPEVTGGILMEMDFFTGDFANMLTAYRQPIYMSSPNYSDTKFEALVDYTKEYVQCMEYAMHATDFTYRDADPHFLTERLGRVRQSDYKRMGVSYRESDFSSDKYENWHYTDFVDIDSVINNMLVCEVSVNWDAMKNSFFMYKDIGSKIVFGPVWDFDWAWGNSMYDLDTAGGSGNSNFKYARIWQTTSDWFANEKYYQTQQFNRLLIRDPYFVVKLYERYHEVRDIILALPDRFAEQTDKYRHDLELNSQRWKDTNCNTALAGGTFEDQYVYTLNFINERVAWLDAQFESVETLMASLNYYISSDEIEVTDIDTSAQGFTAVTVSVTKPEATAVSFQVNGKYLVRADIVNGTATARIPDSAIVNESGRLSVVQVRAVDVEGNYVKNVLGSEYGVYTNAISNYAVFTKTVEVPAEDEDNGNDRSGTDGRDGQTAITKQETVKEQETVETGDPEDNASKLSAGELILLVFAVISSAAFAIYRKKQK